MEIINSAVANVSFNSCDTYCTDNWNPGCCENS